MRPVSSSAAQVVFRTSAEESTRLLPFYSSPLFCLERGFWAVETNKLFRALGSCTGRARTWA
jgi:hypothetical protein